MAGKMGNKLVALCTVALGAAYATGYVVTNTHQALGANALAGSGAVTTQATVTDNNQTSTSNSSSSNGAAATNATASQSNQTSQSSSTNAKTEHGSSTASTKATTAGSSKASKTQTSTQHNATKPPATTTSSKASTSTTKTSQTPSTSNQKYLDGTYHGSGTTRIGTVWVAVTIKGGKIANVQITQADTHYPTAYIDPVLPQEVLQAQTFNVNLVSGATLSSYDFVTGVQQALQQAQNPKYKA